MSHDENTPDAPFDQADLTVEEGLAQRPDAAESAASSSAPPQYGVGPFSVREIILLGVWLVAFLVSFFPLYAITEVSGNVWGTGIDWVLAIFVPTVAMFLIVLRRLSPGAIRRVGSLGIDQFASVAFSVAAVVWLATLWGSFLGFAGAGLFFLSWVAWVETVLMLAGVVLTVCAPWIPLLSDDFAHRPEQPAHRVARDARRVVSRPPQERPAPVAPAAGAAYAGSAYDAAGPHDTAAYGTAPYGQPYAGGPGYPAGAPQGPAPSQEHAYPAYDAEPAYEAPADEAPDEIAVMFAEERDAEVTDDVFADDADVVEDVDDVFVEDEEIAVDATVAADESLGADESVGAEEAVDVDEVVIGTDPVTGDRLAGVEDDSTPPAAQAFWALAPDERTVVDDAGAPLFTIGPTAWALVIEDRGEAFVVRHEDGRIGYLHEVTDVVRG